METTGVAQEELVEVWELGDESYVFVFGDEVSAGVWRRRTKV